MSTWQKKSRPNVMGLWWEYSNPSTTGASTKYYGSTLANTILQRGCGRSISECQLHSRERLPSLLIKERRDCTRGENAKKEPLTNIHRIGLVAVLLNCPCTEQFWSVATVPQPQHESGLRL